MMLFTGYTTTASPRTVGVSHRHGGSSWSRTDSPTAIRTAVPLSAMVSTPLARRGDPVGPEVGSGVGSGVGGLLVGDGSLGPGELGVGPLGPGELGVGEVISAPPTSAAAPLPSSPHPASARASSTAPATAPATATGCHARLRPTCRPDIVRLPPTPDYPTFGRRRVRQRFQ